MAERPAGLSLLHVLPLAFSPSLSFPSLVPLQQVRISLADVLVRRLVRDCED